jgi:ribosomal protein S18 acetylase RimI-like enzyme
MELTKAVTITHLTPKDAPALADFYNDLSAASKRTFRPLGETTTPEVCLDIARDNAPGVAKKFDLVVHYGGHHDSGHYYGGQIIGWGFLWRVKTDAPDESAPPFSLMLGLGIADAYQNHGLGSTLMTRLMAEARRQAFQEGAVAPVVTLTVVQDNEVAWQLYEKHGFVKVGAFVGEDDLPYFRMLADLQATAS